MAEKKTETEEERAAREAREAEEAARRAAEKQAEKQLEDARAQSAETLEQQATAEPYPSQEEADRMKARSMTDSAGGASYANRQMKE